MLQKKFIVTTNRITHDGHIDYIGWIRKPVKEVSLVKHGSIESTMALVGTSPPRTA